MSERDPTESFHPRWAAVGMTVLGDREAAKGLSETYQFVVGRSSFYFTVDDGAIRVCDGRAKDPVVTWTTDEDTWADIASGKITASSAAATGALTVAGDPQATKRLRKIFSRYQMLAHAKATIDGPRQQG